MDLNIDTLYLELDHSQMQRLIFASYTPTQYIYRDIYNHQTFKTFTFEYSLHLFKIDNFMFRAKQFKRGRYRLELFGLHQYNRDSTLKDNNILTTLYPLLRYATIKRIDLCKDTPRRPQQHRLRTKKLVNFKGTIYHNLYTKNYFSSYTYDKQIKNKLSMPLYRTEYSFKAILRANRYKHQLRDLNKLIKRCERFINNLPNRAKKLNSLNV